MGVALSARPLDRGAGAVHKRDVFFTQFRLKKSPELLV
jgi:hypothetical protein